MKTTNMTKHIIISGSLALLLSSCGKTPETPPPNPSTPPVGVFVQSPPEGNPIAIPAARLAAQPGQPIVVEGKIMGVPSPFVDARAAFVLGDEATITPCNEIEGDNCPTPWDACCDPSEVRQAGTATIQLVTEDGSLLRQSLKGSHGLKELSRVRVQGTIAPNSTPESMVINASALYVYP